MGGSANLIKAIRKPLVGAMVSTFTIGGSSFLWIHIGSDGVHKNFLAHPSQVYPLIPIDDMNKNRCSSSV